jgi:hypothetical protein
MEPNRTGLRPNHMFADTAAIAAVGAELSRTAGDLAAVAAAMPTAADSAAELLGPVGAAFLTALAEALTEASQSAGRLAQDISASAGTAVESAAAYADTERRAGHAIATLGG